MPHALLVDVGEFLPQAAEKVGANAHMTAGVVAHLEAVPVQLGDLSPSHVIGLVGQEAKTLGDEEGPPKPSSLSSGRTLPCSEATESSNVSTTSLSGMGCLLLT